MTSPALLLTFISGLTVAHYAAAGPYEPCPFDPCIVLKEINALKEALEARDVPKVAFSARTSKGGAYGNFQGDTTLTYNAVITNVGDAYNPPTGVATANESHGKLGNVLRRMPFLTQPSQSNRAWDRHRSREGNREQPGVEPWFHGRTAPQTATS
ncbi:cerebellin 11 isoform X2 [Oryzias latipes]